MTAFLLSAASSWANDASPHPIKEKQPDGSSIVLYIRGDEHYHWLEDGKGYTVVESQAGFVYAKLDSSTGDLAPTDLRVGQANPEALGLKEGILPTPEVMAAKDQFLRHSAKSHEGPDHVAPLGTVKNLVIPIRFTNHAARTVPSQSDMNTLFNAVGGDPNLCPTGSVRDVYLENSYNQMTLDSTVMDWVDVSESEEYYANNDSGDETLWEALREALDAIDDDIDFDDFDADNDDNIDAIAFLHSGYGAEWGGTDVDGAATLDRIWSHRWTMAPVWTSDEGVKVAAYHISPSLWDTEGSDIGRVGVICHETGHFFGLPDLYDTDSTAGEGAGSWCMMANSWGFDFEQYNPPHFSAWSKIFLGWTTPTVLDIGGEYSIDEWALNNEVYRIDRDYPSSEYLLIENRQPAGVESIIPQGGLTIFHIDDSTGYNTQGYPGQSGWPTNGNHYRVAVLQADGNYNLEKGNNRGDAGDTFREGGKDNIGPETVPNTNAYKGGTIIDTGVAITDISAAGSTMTFHLSFGDDIDVTPEAGFSAIGGIGGPFTPSSATYTLTNTHDSEDRDWTAAVVNGSAWLEVDNAGGTLAPDDDVTITYSITAAAESLPGGTYTDTILITDVDTGYEFQFPATLQVAVYSFPMDTNPGWTTTGAWAFGVPAGLGGSRGTEDPTAGYTGANVYGYNLNGDYANNLSTVRYLTTTAMNFANYDNVTLQFRRWLGVEGPSFDKANLQVSTNGTSWTTVWQNTTELSDSSWQLMTYDISDKADRQATVYLRWGMGTTDSSFTFCGWNIDDVMLVGDADCSAAPVITRIGPAEVTVECGGTYADEGATALDTCDLDLTGSIVAVNPVDTSVPGVYTVTYDVSDAGSNAATQVTRTVTVEDSVAPEITLTGDASVTIQCHDVYTDDGATASDTCSGTLDGSIVAVNPVDVDTPGNYTITYDVSDASGNAATQVTRTVIVEDLISPSLGLTGDAEVTVECGDSYADDGATASDNCDVDLSGSIVTSNPVDSGVPGAYTVTYNVSDASGNPALEMTRAVTVADTQPPSITLEGEATVTLECGEDYTDEGATASDNCDADLTVVTVNPVDAQVPGVYTITYNVSDSAGLAATEVTRSVTVEDTQPPVIALDGDAEVTVECGAEYVDAGATATDACEGDLQVVVINPVDTHTPGEYTITYNASDGGSRAATEVTRTVIVEDTTAPVITLAGEAEVEVPCHTVYQDAGVTAEDNCDGIITIDVSMDNPVNTEQLGTFTITYDVTDSHGNVAETVTRSVTVVDDVAPAITLQGEQTLTIPCLSDYVDAGATAQDNCDGPLTESIQVTGFVETHIPGIYTLTYQVNDSSSNFSDVLERTVTVEDNCFEGGEEGPAEGIGEGIAEGVVEGVAEGAVEGIGEGGGFVEGDTDGGADGEGIAEGVDEGIVEGIVEGIAEGEGAPAVRHSADPNGDDIIALTELLRVIQLYNALVFGCAQGTEDGFAPGSVDQSCGPHTSDYAPQDWKLLLTELLRLIQFFNLDGYHPCPNSEDGFCAGK